MCESHKDSSHDVEVGRHGRVGWRVVNCINRQVVAGPYRGYTCIRGKWHRAEPAHVKLRPGFRLGFHGFCFFWDKASAEAYLRSFLGIRPFVVEKVLVRGWIKAASVWADREIISCYLAEWVKHQAK